jgi:hypothetical protein
MKLLFRSRRGVMRGAWCVVCNRRWLPLVALLTSVLAALGQQGSRLPTTPVLNPEKEGAELAARLRSAVPDEEAEFSGTLQITTRDDKTTTVPIRSVITPGETNWVVTYHAFAAGSRPAEHLVIVHTVGGANVYNLGVETNALSARLHLAEVRGDQLARPFAGSDFWLCDLGLEFLHWPQQRLLRHEMRRSRSCWVLESTTPQAISGGYARVLSWIDVEHDGILRAEAYGKDGKLMKEFLLGAMRKVDGHWQLESMKMRSARTGSETELKFDLPKKP